MRIYTVKNGDNLYDISAAQGVELSSLIGANQLTDPSKLTVGQALVIPGPSSANRSIVVNGYAFPNISEAAFSGAAPYLTYLSVFACRARMDGSLSEMNDTAIIRRAYVSGVAPLLTVTNQRESGGFSSEIVHSILTDETAKEQLIDNLLEYLDRRNYFGLNVDFEYIPEGDRELYTAFLEQLAGRLKRVGYVMSVALAPKVSGEQTGLLYTAHDYPAIGGIADYVILMTYEWGYTYGPPQAVAPIDQVDRVLSYAASVMPSEKILMGMPNYGYNWTLPYRQGTAAQTITLSGAPPLAYRQYADIRYDDAVQAPYFSYYDSAGTEHIVWFDDPRSIAARLELIDRYNLGGVSWWNINTLYRPGWEVLRGLYTVEKAFER